MAAIGFQLEKSGEKEMLKQCYSKRIRDGRQRG